MRRRKREQPRESDLLVSARDYLSQRSNEELVIAMEASYLPNGGHEVFWIYDRISHFEGHAAHVREDGSILVRSCEVVRSRMMSLLNLEVYYRHLPIYDDSAE